MLRLIPENEIQALVKHLSASDITSLRRHNFFTLLVLVIEIGFVLYFLIKEGWVGIGLGLLMAYFVHKGLMPTLSPELSARVLEAIEKAGMQ